MKKTFKILLAAMLFATMLVSFAGASDALNDFADAPAADNWKFAGLASAVENGIMNGANGKLNPDAPLTRAELTAMMVRVLGAQQDKTDVAHFVDVAIDAWYADYIKSGVAVKIINGSGNKMMPNDPVTREQAFAILARTFVLAADNSNKVNSFADANRVSDWAKDATAALIENNIVQGGSANDIRPKANVTRAEYAAMLDRLVGAYAKPGESYAGKTIKGSIVVSSADVDLTGAIIEGKIIITDAVRDGEVKLDGVKASDLVMRSGTAVVSGNASIKNVVYGNPIHKAEVKAENGATVEKVVVAENATEVNNEISADKVEIKADGADVTLGGNTEYKDVEVKAEDVTVDVEEGTKVDNTTVPEKPADDDKPVEDKPADDKPTTSDPSDSPDVSTIPTTTTLDLKKVYVTYGEDEKIYADIVGKEITFDFTSADYADVVLDKICIEANKGGKVSHYLGSFAISAEGVDISSILGKLNETAGNNGKYDVVQGLTEPSIENLEIVTAFAYEIFGEQADLLKEHGITFVSAGEVEFDVTIASEAYTVVVKVNTLD